MIAITTRYDHGTQSIVATNMHGEEHAVRVQPELSPYDNHLIAAKKMFDISGFTGQIIGGATQAGFAYIMLDPGLIVLSTGAQ